MKWKFALAALLVAVTVAGTAAARAAHRRGDGVAARVRQYYASLLRPEQRPEAEKAWGDFLAQTAPDRDRAAARLLVLRADAVAVLTLEQRQQAGRLREGFLHRSPGERLEAFDRLLDGTDREALAGRLEGWDAASPEGRVQVGAEVLDQMLGALEPKVAERLAMTPAQREQWRALYAAAKDDLRPVAVRLETAKAELVRRAVGLLDAEQKAKFDAFRADLRAKVLAFVRGS